MSFIVTILMLCFFANSISSGTLAIVPSSLMISQMTPAGYSLASFARSTEPSVCPALCNTPPGLALRGKTCPGLEMSSGFIFGSIAVCIVFALSAADMPVVTPFLASMETVNAVPNVDVFSSVIIGRFNSSTRSGVRERHMSPLPYFAMKLIASGVIFSAAIQRSPSFSLSSSSTSITILPAVISSKASSTVLNLYFSKS